MADYSNSAPSNIPGYTIGQLERLRDLGFPMPVAPPAPPPPPAPPVAPAPYTGPPPASGLYIKTEDKVIPAWTAIPDTKNVYSLPGAEAMGTSFGASVSGVKLPASGDMQEYKLKGWSQNGLPMYVVKFEDTKTGQQLWSDDPQAAALNKNGQLVPVNWTEESYLSHLGIDPNDIQKHLITNMAFKQSDQMVNAILGDTSKAIEPTGLIDQSGKLIEPMSTRPIYGSGVWTPEAAAAQKGVTPAQPGAGSIAEYKAESAAIAPGGRAAPITQSNIPGEWPLSVQTALVPKVTQKIPTFKAEGQPMGPPVAEPISEKEIRPGVLSETIYDKTSKPIEIAQPIYKQIYDNDTLEQRVQKVNDNIETWANMTGEKIAANPAEFAGNFALGMIPVVGTVALWDKMEPWEKGVSIALDLAVLIPFVGEISAGVRGGASVGRAFGRAVISEVKAPFTAIAHPIETMKAGVMPIETLLRGDKVPLTALEIRTNTVRLPIADIGSAKDTMAARDILVDRAIRGDKPSIIIADKQIELSSTALHEVVIPAAVHATPDVRPFIEGVTVQGTREGGLFVSPTLHTRFTSASAFGDLPEGGIKGAVIIRDENVLSKLQPTGKIYRGSAEMEKVLPEGVTLPAASQMLMTRNVANEPLALVVIGTPFTASEIAKMKLVGAADLVTDIFRPAITVAGKASKYDELIGLGREAKILGNEIKVARAEGKESSLIEKMRNELTALDDEARIRATAIDREYAASNALRPIGVTVGGYMDSLTYNALARSDPDKLAYILSTATLPERERVINGLDSQYRNMIVSRTNQIVSGDRKVSRDIIERASIPPERSVSSVERVSVLPDRVAPERALQDVRPMSPAGRVVATSERNVLPNERIVVPADRVNQNREIVTPERLVVPEARIVTPAQRVVVPTERVPIMPVVIPLENKATPRETIVIKTKHGEKTVTREQLEGAIAWKQGIMYITWVKPFDESDLLYTRKPIPEVKYFTGPGSAAKSIVALHGEVPDFLHAHMGVVDVNIKGQGAAQPILTFKEDRYVSRRPRKNKSQTGIWSSGRS
jgi:hypothetical protein